MQIKKLVHGGIMVNYKCNAACRHCLYACAPTRTGGYMTAETAQKVCDLLVQGGCYSVHIGGGEPFLDFGGLMTLVKTLRRAGISIEYIETNGFWSADKNEAVKKLKELIAAGGNALCISVDPFHAEFVPPERPVALAELCRSTGMDYFLWQQRFLPMLSRLDMSKAHSRSKLENAISPYYILETANSYGLRFGGRAINIEEEYASAMPLSQLLDSSPCAGLASGSHFHIDVYGRLIPPGCAGITIPLEDAVNGIADGAYPVMEALYKNGTAGLFEYASNLGFVPDEKGYTSKCVLCFYIRKWLCENAPSPELYAEHYEHSVIYSYRQNAK